MIAIIDYGMGNLNSVSKALSLALTNQNLKYKICITKSSKLIRESRAIILPGVGAFKEAMKNLERIKIIDELKDAINDKIPFLGICLGFQLLFEKSFEHGVTKGLGVFKGNVKHFNLPVKYRIPHMGWNSVNSGNCKLFNGIKKHEFFYFVHSYYVETFDKGISKITTGHGKKFCSGVYADNVYGLQFHPEKSQGQGIKVLENFCKIL